MKYVFVLLLLFAGLQADRCNAGEHVTVSNLRPQVDRTGKTVDLHDGCILYTDSVFYWYGVSYGKNSPFHSENAIRCFRSKSLSNWEEVPLNLDGLPAGAVCFQPRVLYNRINRQYVLWMLWKDQVGNAFYASFRANSPSGKYKLVNPKVKVFNQADGLSGFALFADTDGTAYLSYTTLRDLGTSVERLSADYCSSTLQNGGYLTSGNKLGAMFSQRGKYYLLMDETVGFEAGGTGAKLFVSNNPMNSYVLRRNINRYPGSPAPLLTDKRMEPNLNAVVRKHFNDGYSPIELEFGSEQTLDGIKVALFTGNRQLIEASASVGNLYESVHTPSVELYVWKNGGWVRLRAVMSALTSSVYTILTLKAEPVTGRHFQLRFASSNASAFYVNEIECFNSKVPLNETPQAYVCDVENKRCLPRIPAQTSCVFQFPTSTGTVFCWMADLWGSSSDNTSGHDYVYLSNPLEFNGFGEVESMRWSDGWSVNLP